MCLVKILEAEADSIIVVVPEIEGVFGLVS